jgi:hypothetical protein
MPRQIACQMRSALLVSNSIQNTVTDDLIGISLVHC